MPRPWEKAETRNDCEIELSAYGISPVQRILGSVFISQIYDVITGNNRWPVSGDAPGHIMFAVVSISSRDIRSARSLETNLRA